MHYSTNFMLNRFMFFRLYLTQGVVRRKGTTLLCTLVGLIVIKSFVISLLPFSLGMISSVFIKIHLWVVFGVKINIAADATAATPIGRGLVDVLRYIFLLRLAWLIFAATHQTMTGVGDFLCTDCTTVALLVLVLLMTQQLRPKLSLKISRYLLRAKFLEKFKSRVI